MNFFKQESIQILEKATKDQRDVLLTLLRFKVEGKH